MATGQTTVGVTPVGDTIEVRFKYQGKTYRPRLMLKPTKAHMQHASRVRQAVMQAIADGTFVLIRASAPTSAQLIEAAGALAQVFSDVLGTKCQLKLIVEPQK